MSDPNQHDENKPHGVKPALPPGSTKPAGVKPAGPAGVKPAGPAGVKPAGPAGVKPAGPAGVKPVGPAGVKPAGPAGVKPAGPAGVKPPGPAGVKPAGPAGVKPAGPAGMKPAGPAGVKPAGPAGVKPVGPAAKPAGPPAARPAAPPEIAPGGDGAPDVLTRKDFTSDQDVRWCPGCGDYAILAAVQRLMPDLGVRRENTVFISGIGCSSRFPYYMNTYGLHSIHGRAPAIATGLKTSRPELDVWIVTGDGDSLSIGGNHLIHLMRRNVNVQLLLFNNQIYGLTKGQYSPTSELGKITKSTPYGSIDHPFNPVTLALGADATFVARSIDRDPKHLTDTLRSAHAHRGSSFVEIYQNCNIFNDGAFARFTERDSKSRSVLYLEHGRPMTFDGGTHGVRLDGFHLETIDLTNGRWSADDCVVYDESSIEMATIAGRMFWQEDLPRPFGVFYRTQRAVYDDLLHTQIEGITEKRGRGDLDALLRMGDTWEV